MSTRATCAGPPSRASMLLPIMREQRSGVIINISSAAAPGLYPYVAYKSTKAGVVALTEQLALQNAPFNIRVNAILPGLIATPMAVETRSRQWNRPREQLMDGAERESTARSSGNGLGRGQCGTVPGFR